MTKSAVQEAQASEKPTAAPAGDPSGDRPNRTRRLRRRSASLLTVLMVALAAALAIYTGVSLANDASKAAVVLPIALAAAGALFVVAMTSVETFVLIVLGVRASLDVLKIGSGSGGAADPSVLLVGLLVMVTMTWLFIQEPEDRRPLSQLTLASMLFAAAALVGVLTSSDTMASAIEWTRIAAITVMLLLLEQLTTSRDFSRRVLIAIYASAVFPLIVAAIQATTGIGVFSTPGFDRVTGTFTHSNPFAAYLTILLIAAVAFAVPRKGRARIGWIVIILALGAALLATYTRGAWIAALVGILVVLWYLRRKLILPLLAVVMLLAALSPGVVDRFSDLSGATGASDTQNSLSWRLEYWTDALRLSENSPVLGVGLKEVASQLPAEKQPHNDYLRAYVELGMAGLAAMIFLFVSMIMTARTAIKLTTPPEDDAPARAGPTDLMDRSLAVAFAGISAALIVMSVAANVMSQVAVLWYAMAFAALALGVIGRASRRAEQEASV